MIVPFSNNVWFYLSGYVNLQNNSYWPADNPLLTKSAIRDVKVGVVCFECNKKP